MAPAPEVNILIVDDRPENLLALTAVLKDSGYNLVTAASGEEALRRLLELDFALILMDVQMPEMDGFECARLIKQREKARNIPIIFVTAISKDEPYIYKGYDSGAVDYIFKPVDADILRSKVSVFAELHRKSLELQRQASLQVQNERLRTEQMLAQQELASLRRERVADQKYRDLVEGIRDGIVWTADLALHEFSFVSSQVQHLTGHSAEQWRTPGFFLEQLLPGERAAVAAQAALAAVSSTGASFEHRFRGASGTLWFHTSLRAAELADGVTVVRGLSVDVTQLKSAEQRAAEAVRVREDFISVASHELRTPLTPLGLQLFRLMRLVDNVEPPRVKEQVKSALTAMHRSVERLQRLTESLLDVSRINHGRLSVQTQACDLAALVSEAAERFHEALANAGCELRTSVQRPLQGEFDPVRMEQIVANLLGNAIKFGSGRPIHLRLEERDGHACLAVRDEGPGIPEADQARVFEKFERAAGGALDVGGLGLGLFVVREIARAHGGDVSVHSKPGEGAEFRVRIPVRQA